MKHLLQYGGTYIIAIFVYVMIFWLIPGAPLDNFDWRGPLFMHIAMPIIFWSSWGLAKKTRL